MKSRLDKAQATVATAHAIARVVYRMLKYKVEYETISVEEYEEKYMDRTYAELLPCPLISANFERISAD